MPQNLLACHGVVGLICAVGEGGRILMFKGDLYQPIEVDSPTNVTLRAVWVESPTRAWAAGDATLLRWDGRAWHTMALAIYHRGFSCIWGHPSDGVWFGSKGTLINYRTDGSGGSVITTDLPIRSIWGTGPSDIWYLSAERVITHWTGEEAWSEALPGEEGEEWAVVAGSSPGESVYVAGISGLVMEWDRRQWHEIDSDTTATITGAATQHTDDLWVTTSKGQVRHWDGYRWTVEAFSAFGPLHGLCIVDGIVWACGARGVVIQHRPSDDGGKE